MDEKKTRVEKKPYEKPRVSSSEAFRVEAALCTLGGACGTTLS